MVAADNPSLDNLEIVRDPMGSPEVRWAVIMSVNNSQPRRSGISLFVRMMFGYLKTPINSENAQLLITSLTSATTNTSA
jgi:hypothetical protein